MNFAYWKPETAPDRNAQSLLGSISQQGQYNTSYGLQSNSSGPSEIQYNAPHDSDFRATQTGPESGPGHNRQYSSTTQEMNAFNDATHQQLQAGVDPKTPKKKSKVKSKAATTPKQVADASPTNKSLTARYRDPGAGTPPNDKVTDKAPVRRRRATSARKAQQYLEDPKISTKSRPIREYIAYETDSIVTAEHLFPSAGQQKSPTIVEKLPTRVPPFTSDGSPSRKPRNGGKPRHPADTQDIDPQPTGHNDHLQKTKLAADFSVEQWPPLRSMVPAPQTEQSISETQVLAPMSTSGTSDSPKPATAAKNDGRISGHRDIDDMPSDRTNQAGQKRESSITSRPYQGPAGLVGQVMSSNTTICEKTEALVVRESLTTVSEDNDTATATEKAAEKLQHTPKSIVITDELSLIPLETDVAHRIGRDESMNEALELSREVDIPENNVSANDSRTQSSAGGFEMTSPLSYSHTERSDSWAEGYEEQAKDVEQNGVVADWAKASKSSKSTAAMDLHHSSGLLGTPGCGKNEEAVLQWKTMSWRKKIKDVETTGRLSKKGDIDPSATSDLKVDRIRPLTGCKEEQGHSNPSSFEAAESVPKATGTTAGAHLSTNSMKEVSKATELLEDDTSTSIVETVVPIGGEVQRTPKADPADVIKNSTVRTGKRKVLKINVPPRTPSPTTSKLPSSTLSSSPKIAKRKERFELPLRTSSLPEPSPPISTHMKKKKVLTPSGKMNRKESGTAKSKEIAGKESRNSKAITTETTKVDSTSQTAQENELHNQATMACHLEAALSNDFDTKIDGAKEANDNKPDAFFSGHAVKPVPRLVYPAPDPGSAVLILEVINKPITPQVELMVPNRRSSISLDSCDRSPKTPQSEVSQSAAEKNKKKNKKTSKARAKGKKQISSAFNSAVQPLPAPKLAAFPTKPLDSPGSESQDSLTEGEMFPPLSNPLPSNASPMMSLSASTTQFTCEWTKQAIETAMEVQKGRPPPSLEETAEQFDQGRSQYQKQKVRYDLYKFGKQERLAGKGLGISFASEAGSKRRKTSPGVSDVEDSIAAPNVSSTVDGLGPHSNVAGSSVVRPQPKVVLPYNPDDRIRILNSPFKPLGSNDEPDCSTPEPETLKNKSDRQSIIEDRSITPATSPLTSPEEAFVADALINELSTTHQPLSSISEFKFGTEQDIFNKPIHISRESVAEVAGAPGFDALSTLNTISEAMKIFQAETSETPQNTISDSIAASTDVCEDKTVIPGADIEASTRKAIKLLKNNENALLNTHSSQPDSLELIAEARKVSPEAEEVQVVAPNCAENQLATSLNFQPELGRTELVAPAPNTRAGKYDTCRIADIKTSSASLCNAKSAHSHNEALALTEVHGVNIPELGTVIDLEMQRLDPSAIPCNSSKIDIQVPSTVPTTDLSKDNSGSSIAIASLQETKKCPSQLLKIDPPAAAPPISVSPTSQEPTPLTVTQADFPALTPGKPAFIAAAAPILSFPFARPMAPPSRLSEANIAAFTKNTALPEPQNEPRLRRHTSAMSSEYSTTSSVRRKLFSETMSPRPTERGSREGHFVCLYPTGNMSEKGC